MEEAHISSEKKRHTYRLEKISSVILMVTMFLLPVFFIPSGLFSVPFAKSFILYAGILLSLIAFLFSILESGTIRISKNPVFYFALAIPVIYFISSLSSVSMPFSFAGYGVEVGTFSFVLLAVILMSLVAYQYKTKERIFYSYLLYFLSFGIITLYQIIRLIFGAGFLSFGLLTSSVSNLIGSWNDLGVFFAVAALLAIMTLELLQVNKTFKWLLYISLVISLVFVSIVNFSLLWYVLAAFSLIFFLFVMFVSREAHESHHESHEEFHPRKVSFLSLGMLVLSLIFIFGGSGLGNHIANALNVSNIEVRPSWSTTWSISKQALSHNILLGSGPGTFQYDWAKYKPLGINATAFWSTDFNSGIGLIPTFLATTGILGLLAWLGLILSIIYLGVRAIFSPLRDVLVRYLVVSSFITSVCLWVMLIFYVPSMVMVALTFFFTGLFLAALGHENLITFTAIPLYRNARVGFVTVLATVFALIISCGSGYYIIRNFISSSYFQKSLTAANANNLALAESDMQSAIGLRGFDIYYRSLAQIEMLKLNALLSSNNTDADQVNQQFQQVLGAAIQSGLSAVNADPSNYQNYLELGQIYESVVPAPFKITGAYDKAKEEYQKALALDPNNPEINLVLGRLEVANGDLDAAKTYVNQAIAQKSDYVDAYFLLSQIEVQAGDTKQAIASAQSATYLAPDNASVYFQLGLLQYNDSDFASAVTSFQKALTLVPDYANAQYFLGLSYYKTNKVSDAIAQFEDLNKSNPNNPNVTTVLDNLKAGKDPFAGASSTVDTAPEKGQNLPVEQEDQ